MTFRSFFFGSIDLAQLSLHTVREHPTEVYRHVMDPFAVFVTVYFCYISKTFSNNNHSLLIGLEGRNCGVNK